MFIKVIGDTQTAGYVVGGPLFWLYNVWLIILYILSIVLLLLKIPLFADFHKKNIIIFLSGLILGGIPAVFIDLVGPLINLQNVNYLFGVISSVFWLGAVSYIVGVKSR